MNVKKFYASTSRQALYQVRHGLGPDALILSNRAVDGGVEILAMAKDELPAFTAPAQEAPREQKVKPATPGPKPSPMAYVFPQAEASQASTSPRESAPRAAAAPVPRPDAGEDASTRSLANEIKSMRGMIEEQLVYKAWDTAQQRDPGNAKVLSDMLRAGFSPALARQLLGKMPPGLALQQKLDWVKSVLDRNLHIVQGTDEIVERGGVYALAGTDTSSPRVRGEGEVIGHLPVESLPEPISSQSTVWELMHDASHLATLSADGRARLERTRPVLAACMARRLRASLRDQVEGAWLALGGPACAADDTDLEDADIYLDHLETFEEAGAITDSAAFDESLAKLFAQPDLAASERLQIMSIHKAKGLEFGTVIVPGLGSGTGRDERELFKWMELAGEEAGLLLAPINPTGSDKDPIYETIRRLDKTKGAHEAGRLLYVAATRAKRHLHLLGSVKLALKDGATEIGSPAAGSLLEKLWPVVAAEFEQAAALFSNAESAVDTPSPRLRGEGGGEGQLRRLISAWSMPDVPSALAWNAPGETARAQDDIEYSWVGETARHVGSVVHRWLQRIAEDELKDWDEARVASMRESFVNELAARGVEEAQLAAAANRVAKALSNALADPRGRWLLGPQREARNEYRLTAVIAGERRRLVIDRTYADEGGRRWIVDYKTSGHEGTDVEGFLDQERERYRAQLERYAKALAQGDATMLGLYFPLLAGWREWGA